MIVSSQKIFAQATLVVSLALGFGMPAWPQTANVAPAVQQARDALTLFGEGCLETFADPAHVAAKMDQFKATRLDDKGAAALSGGKAGAQAWRVGSPGGAQMALVLVAPTNCSVMIRRADTVALQNEVPQLLDALVKGGHMVYHVEHHDVHKAPGGNEETTDYLLQLAGNRDASVSVTTNPGTAEDLQGLLSLTKLGEK